MSFYFPKSTFILVMPSVFLFFTVCIERGTITSSTFIYLISYAFWHSIMNLLYDLDLWFPLKSVFEIFYLINNIYNIYFVSFSTICHFNYFIYHYTYLPKEIIFICLLPNSWYQDYVYFFTNCLALFFYSLHRSLFS